LAITLATIMCCCKSLNEKNILRWLIQYLCMSSSSTGSQSVQQKLFAEYYNKLVDILPANDLSHYFVSERVISLTDHENIMRSSRPQKAARLLLERVSHQLHNGNGAVLNKMLSIMEHHGIATAKIIAAEITDKLLEVKYVASSSEQGKENEIHM